MRNISWLGPVYWGNEEQYVSDALKSTWISGGAYVERFEEELSKYFNAPHVITTSNGTTALHLAYLAAGIGAGDEVIVPGFGFMAAANVAIHVGAKPVFTEVNPTEWCLGANDVDKCITAKTKAIVPIHTYGNMCDMTSIMRLADEKGILVIEDAAEAIGTSYMGKMAGTIAPIGTFSFHATKTITTGEGGAVLTNQAELDEKMRLYRSHGMSKRRYWHDVAGHNFRLTNMHAALGCAQLEQVEKIKMERSRVYKTYVEALSAIDGVELQHYSSAVVPVVWAVAVVLSPEAFPQGREAVIDRLMSDGIESRPGFYSASSMSHLYGQMTLPICEYLSRQVLSLPSSPRLTEEEINFICNRLERCKR